MTQTLHDHPDLPSASSVANALVELAAPTLSRAWSYLCDWQGLETARVPAPFRRLLLDADAAARPDLDTESTEAIREWARLGAGAPKILVGDVGVGKSYAAARWVLDRHRAGRATLWTSVVSWGSLSFDELRAEQRMAINADGLVLDDLGGGGSIGKVTVEAIQTVLLERTNAGQGTVVLCNGEAAVVLKLLGKRMIDRLKAGPPRSVIQIKSKLSLRGPLPADDPDKIGRGRAYRRAMVLVETFGAVNGSGSPVSFRLDAKPEVCSTPTFGGALVTRCSTDQDWVAEAERARLLIKVDANVVVELAKTIHVDCESGWSAQANDFFEKIRQGIAAQRRAETQAWALSTSEIVKPALARSIARARARTRSDQGSWRDGHYGKLRVPELDEKKLKELGFCVVADSDGAFKLERLIGKGKRREVMSIEHPTEHDAWLLANAIAFGVDPSESKPRPAPLPLGEAQA